MENETPIILMAESLFGMKTRRGLVKLSEGLNFEVTMSPVEAKAYAATIIAAAEAAETDEMIWNWLDSIGIRDDDKKSAVLSELRKMRRKAEDRDAGDFRRMEIESIEP